MHKVNIYLSYNRPGTRLAFSVPSIHVNHSSIYTLSGIRGHNYACSEISRVITIATICQLNNFFLLLLNWTRACERKRENKHWELSTVLLTGNNKSKIEHKMDLLKTGARTVAETKVRKEKINTFSLKWNLTQTNSIDAMFQLKIESLFRLAIARISYFGRMFNTVLEWNSNVHN